MDQEGREVQSVPVSPIVTPYDHSCISEKYVCVNKNQKVIYKNKVGCIHLDSQGLPGLLLSISSGHTL